MAKSVSKSAGGAGGRRSSKSGGVKSRRVATFASLAVARSGAGGAGVGGRYNPKTRRLVVPASFAGQRVSIVVDGDLLIVGGAGAPEASSSCHPTQHFVTVPAGVVPAGSPAVPVDLVPAEKLPASVRGIRLPADCVGWHLPVVKKSGGRRRSPKSGGAGSSAPAGAKASGGAGSGAGASAGGAGAGAGA